MARHPLPDHTIELIARRFPVLADPTRIRLLDRLCRGKATVQDLTETVGSSKQNLSKHLVLLLEAGIVRRRKAGNSAYYAIADESVFDLCEAVCGGLADHAASVREAVATGLR
jgi:DNA-binding transcriptional ArsR family regulator